MQFCLIEMWIFLVQYIQCGSDIHVIMCWNVKSSAMIKKN